MKSIVDIPSNEILSLAEAKRKIQSQYHPHCVVCSPTNPHGLQLTMDLDTDGILTGDFRLDRAAEGYRGVSHGGVIAAILDGAMGNWLFAYKIVAVTVDLKVRYRHPLRLGSEARVEAWLKEHTGPLYILKARIKQGNHVMAQCIGRFVHKPDIVETGEC